MGELTLTERNNEIKILLIRALEGVLRYGGEIYAIPYLTKILEDDTLDPETRALAAHSLGWSRRKSTVPYLVKFTQDRNNTVRRSVAWSLFAQSKRDPELMLPFVIEAIRVEEEPYAIEYFAWALRDIGNKNAIPALKEALARGVQRKDRSISSVIQALIRLDNSVIREILTDGSDFESRLLGEQVSYIRAVDSSFREILLDRKEAIHLRRSVITLIRQEGEK